jgi:hypothetical protein
LARADEPDIFQKLVGWIVGSQAERLTAEFAATSGWGRTSIDQLIVFSFEWVNERDPLQRETIFANLSKQVPHARTMCEAHNIASQNAKWCALTASSAAKRSQ